VGRAIFQDGGGEFFSTPSFRPTVRDAKLRLVWRRCLISWCSPSSA